MNLQKMYALGKKIYVDMDSFQKSRSHMAIRDKHGACYCHKYPLAFKTSKATDVLKQHIAATKQQSIEAYENA
jgi:hypothetical protein